VKKILIAGLVVLALAAIVFASVRANGRDKGAKVYTDAARRQKLGQVVKASGEIDPRVKVNISAHVVGKIQKLYVEEGDRIEKGRPFLELEKEAYTAARDQWAAQLRRAQTDVRQAQVSLADTGNKLERARRLKAEGISSEQDLEAAELAQAQARLRLEDARESVQQAQANLDKARDDLAKTTIFSPLTGRVVDLNAEEGEVVVSGTMNNPGSVIATVADLSEILANVDVDETEIVNVHPGQKATIRVDALPDRTYEGRVVRVGSSGFNRPAQPDVTFFDVEILLDNPTEDLRPKMSVRAEIETREQSETLAVPIQAVVSREPLGNKKAGSGAAGSDDDEVKAVFVVADGKAHQREVRTGISDETRVEILSGLKAGEQVVTGPYRSLRDLKDGDEVQITKPEDDKKARAGGGPGGNADQDDEADDKSGDDN
jgi:HlyD family secretion protein